jgi:hypothetical protein
MVSVVEQRDHQAAVTDYLGTLNDVLPYVFLREYIWPKPKLGVMTWNLFKN